MKLYNKLLLALELTDGCDQHLLDKAMEIVKDYGAKLYLVHAVEHMSYATAYGVAISVEVEEALIENANKAMDKVGAKYHLSKEQLIVKMGPAKIIILDEAEALGVDLIVVGSHGRHGLRLLLGSTANAILHGAKCDVLAVRVKE